MSGLAASGSNVTPWLIVAGIIVLLGVIALVVAGVVRSRRAEHQVEDAAVAVADAGGELPIPNTNASASDETIIHEAADLAGGAAHPQVSPAPDAPQSTGTDVPPAGAEPGDDAPSK